MGGMFDFDCILGLLLQSDTASVLHEALGYIRFLHDQVQVRVCVFYIFLN